MLVTSFFTFARACSNMGNVVKHLGEPERAIRYLEEAHRTFTEYVHREDHPEVITKNMEDMMATYFDLGNFAKAEGVARELLGGAGLRRQNEEAYNSAITVLPRALMLQHARDPAKLEEAVRLFELCIAFKRESPQVPAGPPRRREKPRGRQDEAQAAPGKGKGDGWGKKGRGGPSHIPEATRQRLIAELIDEDANKVSKKKNTRGRK